MEMPSYEARVILEFVYGLFEFLKREGNICFKPNVGFSLSKIKFAWRENLSLRNGNFA